MPRPSLPRAKDVAEIAKTLRDEGFRSICIETSPDGGVSITVATPESEANVTPLEAWKASRGSA